MNNITVSFMQTMSYVKTKLRMGGSHGKITHKDHEAIEGVIDGLSSHHEILSEIHERAKVTDPEYAEKLLMTIRALSDVQFWMILELAKLGPATH